MVELVKRYYMISIIIVIVIIAIFLNILNTNNNDSIKLVVNNEKQEDINTDEINNLSGNAPVETSSIITNSVETHYQSEVHDINKVLNNTQESNLNSNVVNSSQQSIIQPDPPINNNEKPSMVPVYICGEIKNPGVYEVTSNKLINDIVNLAGGFTDDADTRAINLASKISSNEMIIVPKIGEIVEQIQTSYDNVQEDTMGSLDYIDEVVVEHNIHSDTETNLVNINTADKTLLMSLPGIGEVKASSIIEYRESVGGFINIEDIKNVSGIGEKTFEKLTKLITI